MRIYVDGSFNAICILNSRLHIFETSKTKGTCFSCKNMFGNNWWQPVDTFIYFSKSRVHILGRTCHALGHYIFIVSALPHCFIICLVNQITCFIILVGNTQISGQSLGLSLMKELRKSCFWCASSQSDSLFIMLSIFERHKEPSEVFYQKLLKTFTKFTGKHVCQSLFFKKVAQ